MDKYDAIYRQAIKQLLDKATQSDRQRAEKISDFSWAIFTVEDSPKAIDYDLIEKGSLVCQMNRVKQRTDFISIQVDTNKLLYSTYLVETANRLTLKLCEAILYDFVHPK